MKKKLPIYQIGDTFDLDVIGENTNGEYLEKTISVKVDSVQISDDLQLLDPDKIPQEWAKAIDADGKLATNTLNYVKSGDGIDSLDEIVKSEEVNQKLVYVTVTYTNHSNEEIDHMLYLGALLTLTKENGKYSFTFQQNRPAMAMTTLAGTAWQRLEEWYIIVSLKIMAMVETTFPL